MRGRCRPVAWLLPAAWAALAVLLPAAGSAAQVPFVHDVIDGQASGDCKGIGDIDGDGLADVVLAGSQLAVYHWPDWNRTLVDVADEQFTTDLALADIDGDGDLDVVVPDGSAGDNVLWYENPLPDGDPADGGDWARRIVGAGGYVHDVETGDFDADGRPDVLVRKVSTKLFLQAPSGAFALHGLGAAQPKGQGAAPGDIDGDGDLDAALNGYWLENDGDAGFAFRDIDSGDWPPNVQVDVADMDGDGLSDVLLSPSEYISGRISWYEALAPGGPWSERVVDPTVADLHSLEGADVDGDGDSDIVTAQMGGDVVVLSNQGGSGLSWSSQLLATTGSHNLQVGDLGGDGDLDLAGSNFIGNEPLEAWLNGAAAEPSGGWVKLAGGTPGSDGVPVLSGGGPLGAHSDLTLALKDAAPGALGLLCIAKESRPLAVLGGTFHAAPSTTELLLVVGPGGAWNVTWPVPPGIPSGTETWLQAVVVDGAAPFGLALSNGLLATTP